MGGAASHPLFWGVSSGGCRPSDDTVANVCGNVDVRCAAVASRLSHRRSEPARRDRIRHATLKHRTRHAGFPKVDDEVETPKQKRGMKDKPDDASASGYMSPTNMGFICAALFFNTMSAPMVKVTQNADGGCVAPRRRSARAGRPGRRAIRRRL